MLTPLASIPSRYTITLTNLLASPSINLFCNQQSSLSTPRGSIASTVWLIGLKARDAMTANPQTAMNRDIAIEADPDVSIVFGNRLNESQG